MRQIRHALGCNVIDHKLLTCAEKLQFEGYLRQQETNEAIQRLAKAGTSRRINGPRYNCKDIPGAMFEAASHGRISGRSFVTLPNRANRS